MTGDDYTRLLARSLLLEALLQETLIPTPQPCAQSRLRVGGRPERWTRTGAVPTDLEFRRSTQHQLPARMTVMKFWPTLAAAVREAGFVPIPSRRRPPPRPARITEKGGDHA